MSFSVIGVKRDEKSGENNFHCFFDERLYLTSDKDNSTKTGRLGQFEVGVIYCISVSNIIKNKNHPGHTGSRN